MFRKVFSFIILLALFGMACQKHTFDSDLRDAEARLGLGNARSALSLYKSMSKRYADHEKRPVILLRMGKIYEGQLRNNGKALKLYGEVITEYPLSKVAKVAREWRAALEEKHRNYDAAIEDYEMLVKHSEGSSDYNRYRTLLAGTYLSSGKHSQARVELVPVIDAESVSRDILSKALFIYAESYFLSERPRNAIRWYNALISNFPHSEYADEARLHAATCYEELGKLGAARALTESASKYPNKEVIDARLNSIELRGIQSSKENQSPEVPNKTPVDNNLNK